MKKLYVVVLTSAILFFGCKKNEETSTPIVTKQTEKNIISSVGGVLNTSDSIKLEIPPNALSVDGIAFVGRTGQETTSVPNKQLQVVGSPITLRIPSDTIRKTIQLTYQLPSAPSNPENCLVFLFNGTSYYPVERTINGKTINVSIDVIDWEERTSKKAGGLFTSFVCITLYAKQTPSSDQMGLKEVTFQSGTMTFTKPQAISSSSKVVVLIHGWIGSPDGWSTLMQKLQNEKNPSYTNYLTFGYNSSMSIENNAQTLANSLDVYAKGAKIDIIAHSMGGLVSRSAIEHFNGAQSIRRLVTLGTPHLGSPVAAIRYVIGVFVAMDSGLSGYMIYDYTTQGLKDLYTKSNYITGMMTLSSPPIPYYTIAATNDERFYPKLNGSLFIDGPDDGVVGVSSALGVPGAESPTYGPFYLQVPMAHTQMPEDPTIYGYIIKYLKDPVVKPTVSTTNVTNYTATSAAVGGNIDNDGGAPITERGVYWSTSQNPETTGTKLQIGSGTGSFSSNLSGLNPNKQYYVKAYATNSAGTSYGSQMSFTTQQISNITISDVDGNTYTTVTIGSQVWMAENLKTTKYRNGNIIGTTSTATLDIKSQISPKYQWSYDGNENNVKTYGRLYTWYCVTDIRGVCPVGWHVPSRVEWDELANFLGGSAIAGSKLKESGIIHWLSPNSGATNQSGFSALPAGVRYDDTGYLAFQDLGIFGWWWTSDLDPSLGPLYKGINYGSEGLGQYGAVNILGVAVSVRCLKD